MRDEITYNNEGMIRTFRLSHRSSPPGCFCTGLDPRFGRRWKDTWGRTTMRKPESSDMNCRELVECITDYLERRLRSEETQRLEDHLADCPGCRTYLEQMRGLIHAAGKLEERDISTEAKAELLGIFRDLRKGT